MLLACMKAEINEYLQQVWLLIVKLLKSKCLLNWTATTELSLTICQQLLFHCIHPEWEMTRVSAVCRVRSGVTKAAHYPLLRMYPSHVSSIPCHSSNFINDLFQISTSIWTLWTCYYSPSINMILGLPLQVWQYSMQMFMVGCIKLKILCIFLLQDDFLEKISNGRDSHCPHNSHDSANQCF